MVGGNPNHGENFARQFSGQKKLAFLSSAQPGYRRNG